MHATHRAAHDPVGAMGHAPSVWRFLRHLGEMVLAMWVGMVIFAGMRAGLAGTAPVDSLGDHLDFRLVTMAVFMAVPMAALMRVRGHNLERTGEMVGAMVAPVAAVCVMGHVVPGVSDSTVSAASHALMYLGMLLVMLVRFGEYAHAGPHPAVAQT